MPACSPRPTGLAMVTSTSSPAGLLGQRRTGTSSIETREQRLCPGRASPTGSPVLAAHPLPSLTKVPLVGVPVGGP